MSPRDGHVRVLPLHVANKIAAGEVVERPASVAKELLENAIDAGARKIALTVAGGGRKLVSVQDDGCGMTRDDAILSLERQATSKILDVDDIEEIDTLGFRGEAIPSIASVSRFTLTTRRADSDEGTSIVVNAGTVAEIRTAGCPPGTLVEVRDLFCNVPARRKFLRAYATEESHIRQVFTVHALAHPQIAFTLVSDGRELYRLAPAGSLADRVRELFGAEFLETLAPLGEGEGERRETRDASWGEGERRETRDASWGEGERRETRDASWGEGERRETRDASGDERRQTKDVRVTGYIERPNRAFATRREQYVFVNGRPATAPSIAYAIRESYPHGQGDVRPAAIIFIETSPGQVDVNVHPTKREVRFRNNPEIRNAIMDAIGRAVAPRWGEGERRETRDASWGEGERRETRDASFEGARQETRDESGAFASRVSGLSPSSAPAPAPTAAPASLVSGLASSSLASPVSCLSPSSLASPVSCLSPSATPSPSAAPTPSPPPPTPAPVQVEFAVDRESVASRPWVWFKFLAATDSGYLLVETDAGVVTVNPNAARERIAFEALLARRNEPAPVQQLLIPEVVHLSPVESARIEASLEAIRAMGFHLEAFGRDTWKVDAVPQLLGSLPCAAVLGTVARDLADGSLKRTGSKWREEAIAKSVARSFAGTPVRLDEASATHLVEDLASCRMPYVCPRGKPIMIFTSTRELNRKFARE